MIFIFIFLIKCNHSENNGDLYLLFVRPDRNPLEMYPPTKLPLCIHNSMPGFDLIVCSKCKRKIIHITRDYTESFQPWCSTELTFENYTLLADQLKENYSICFSSGDKSVRIPIGHEKLLYTQYSFYFSENNGYISLSKVSTSKLVNFTIGKQLNFLYQIIFTDSQTLMPNPIANPRLTDQQDGSSKSSNSLIYFFLFSIIFLIIIAFFVLKPDFLSNEMMNPIATIPSNNFLIVTLSGAGAGVYGYVIIILILYLLKIPFESLSIILVVPAIASAVFTGAATSFICTICRLKDVASALYFAPLISPAIVLYIIFSIQWIPICFESCITIPMKVVFYYIVTVVIVKLPVNLIAGIIAGSFVTPPPYHTIRSIKIRKFISSRPFFLSISNIFLFVFIFPLYDKLMDTPSHIPFDINISNINLIFIYMPIWIFASGIVGISSLAMADPFNWATLAFVSAAGAGVVLWIVSFFKATIAYGMTGSLQISLHMAILSLICIGLSLSAGGVSVIAAAIWIVATGIPSKNS